MSESLLRVSQLSVAIRGRPVVDGLSFEMAAGEIVALVGESGSGKTISARALIGLCPAGAAVTGGGAVFDGHDLVGAPEAELRKVRGRGVGMIFQEPMTSLDPSMRVGEQMIEGLRTHGEGRAREWRDRCVEMLAKVGLGDADTVLERFPHEFSGGMRQRISIAAAMLMRPRLLIADEPTTALDVLVQKDVLELLVTLTRQAGAGVLLITHDLGLVAEYAQRTVVMRHGRVVEAGLTAELLARPQDPYTRALLHAIPKRIPRASRAKAEPLVEVEGLRVWRKPVRTGLWSRRTEVRAVDGVSFEVRRGETLAVVGASGSGKTTLARAMLGLVPTTGGRIRFDGEDIARLSGDGLRDCRKRIAMIFQDPFSALDPRMRVSEIVEEGLRCERGLPAAERRTRVGAILEDVGLGGDYGRRLPHQLSGGQRQRVNIARALVSEPELVIADEPVSALDVTVQAEILELFRRLQSRRGFACLFISHALSVVEQIADRVMVLCQGRVVEEGPRDAIFDTPRHPYTCALLTAAPRLQSRGRAGYSLAPYAPAASPPPDGFAYAPWQLPAEAPPQIELLHVSRDHRVACIATNPSPGDPP